MDTNELIQQLAQSTPSQKKLFGVRRLLMFISLFLLSYVFVLQLTLGLRDDLWSQFERVTFSIEVLLLLTLLVVSTIASVLARYPDSHQYDSVNYLPFIVFAVLLVFLLAQILLSMEAVDSHQLTASQHGFECTLWIAASASLPAWVLMSMIRRGASVFPRQAGALSVLTATAIGCLTLRLSEMNDSILHLLVWHYIPSFVFALVGAWLGKHLFKW